MKMMKSGKTTGPDDIAVTVLNYRETGGNVNM